MSPSLTSDPNQEFVHLVRTALVRKLRSSYRFSRHDAEDAAAAAVLRLVPKVTDIAAAYPSAQAYAGAVVRNAAEDHRRSQRAQRGEGARLVTNVTVGQQRRTTKRTVVRYDTEFEKYAHPADVADEVTTSVDVQAVLSHLTPTHRWLVQAIAIDGYTVREAARALGISREHASRTYTALITRLRVQHGHLAEAA